MYQVFIGYVPHPRHLAGRLDFLISPKHHDNLQPWELYLLYPETEAQSVGNFCKATVV